MVDFPVPFGPIITFKLDPGLNSKESYVLKYKKLVYFQKCMPNSNK